jgi:hypothetical protein
MTARIEIDHLPTPGVSWICGCPFEAHDTPGQADDCRLWEFRRNCIPPQAPRRWHLRLRLTLACQLRRLADYIEAIPPPSKSWRDIEETAVETVKPPSRRFDR